MDPNQIIIVAGLLLAVLELVLGVSAGFDLVIVGGILIVSGFIGELTDSLTLTLTLTSLLSFLYMFFGRTTLKQKLFVITHRTNIDKLIGGHGVVIRSITPDTPGMVRVEDEDWRAVSSEVLYEKDKVEVVNLSGVTLTVKKRI